MQTKATRLGISSVLDRALIDAVIEEEVAEDKKCQEAIDKSQGEKETQERKVI